MPCYDPDTHERPRRLEAKVHQLTARLCKLCRRLENNMPQFIKEDRDLLAWWEDHKTHDARVEAVNKKEKALGIKALSDEEKRMYFRAGDISY